MQTTPQLTRCHGREVVVAQATLNAMRDENTMGNAKRVGGALKHELQGLMKEFTQLGDVRGAGLFIGADIVIPETSDPGYPTAVRIIEEMGERRVLTSLCGPYGNVLKIRPPLVFSRLACSLRHPSPWSTSK